MFLLLKRQNQGGDFRFFVVVFEEGDFLGKIDGGYIDKLQICRICLEIVEECGFFYREDVIMD